MLGERSQLRQREVERSGNLAFDGETVRGVSGGADHAGGHRGAIHGEALRSGIRAAGREEGEFAEWADGLADGEDRDEAGCSCHQSKEVTTFEKGAADRGLGCGLAPRFRAADRSSSGRELGADVDDQRTDGDPCDPVVGDAEVERPGIPEVDVGEAGEEEEQTTGDQRHDG